MTDKIEQRLGEMGGIYLERGIQLIDFYNLFDNKVAGAPEKAPAALSEGNVRTEFI